MLELRLDPSEEKSVLMFGFGTCGEITHVLGRITLVDDCIEGSYLVDMSSLGHGLSGSNHNNIHAVSYQHALEICIKATTRWLAHQLLLDTSQAPGNYPGPHVVIWHPDPVSDVPEKGEALYYLKLGVSQPILTYSDNLGCVVRMKGIHDWNASDMRDRSGTKADIIACATEEEAVAVVIHHAAPWIAMALIEAFEPKIEDSDV